MICTEKDIAIVADIGGTNARFSSVHLQHMYVSNTNVFSCSDFPDLASAFQFYKQRHNLENIKQAAIAIACPIQGDQVQMTNFHWQFSIKKLKQDLGLKHLKVMNDFTAAAMCIPQIKDNEKIQIGPGAARNDQPSIILGAGTGLGVATLFPDDHGFKVLPGEGGHADWCVHDEQEWFIYTFLSERYGHVSIERVLSGAGIEDIYQALSAFYHQAPQPLDASQIASLALKRECKIAISTINQFIKTLAHVSGDLALTQAALGGVYIAGGIVPKLLKLINPLCFRQCFEAKGRFESYNQLIATYIISASQPGIIGAAAYLRQLMEQDSDVAYE